MDISLCLGDVYRYRVVFQRALTLILFVAGMLCGSVSTVKAEREIRYGENPIVFQGVEEAPSEEGAVTTRGGENQSAPLCEDDVARAEGESEEDFQFRLSLMRMLSGKPIERMIPLIAKRDRETAAFLVAIARKESSWGEHVPSLDGIDCFNYWGYKGRGSRGVGMGHACFGSPEEAIETVGNRIAILIHEKKLNSPERLIVWKCGSSCAGHSPESVAKWIADVRFIYTKVLSKG